MTKEQVLLAETEKAVKAHLAEAEKGHDWQHIKRVRNMALKIQDAEGGDRLLIELAALLHDIDDPKFNGGDLKAGGRASAQMLIALGADETLASKVRFLVENCSFKGGQADTFERSLELQILRDADRLDAIGAIGIARTFHYGGFKNQAIYDPKIPVRDKISPEAYYHDRSSTINHFYEKLLKLKDGMYTQTAKAIAEERHTYMEAFLKRFIQEWEA